MSQHGFARNSNWELAEELATDDVVKAVFHLSDSDSTRALWPHPFLLSYTLSLTAKALTTSLRIENTGEQPFEAQALLHTYLRVKDIGRVGVHGYHGKSFLDKVAPPPHGPNVEERDVATIGEVIKLDVERYQRSHLSLYTHIYSTKKIHTHIHTHTGNRPHLPNGGQRSDRPGRWQRECESRVHCQHRRGGWLRFAFPTPGLCVVEPVGGEEQSDG